MIVPFLRLRWLWSALLAPSRQRLLSPDLAPPRRDQVYRPLQRYRRL